MSWDEYVSGQLIGSGNIKEAAICGHDGSTWATSAGFNVSQAEALKLVAGFTDPSGLQAGGMNISGTKFIFLSSTDEVLRGKKETRGVHIAKTKTAIIIAIYEEPIQPPQVAITVEALAEYLRGVNY